ncbi:MAG: Uma2 family endonuclease [Burkholderiales bacterium]|nr:Uma2 family endonuclease [Burkholderiales bacterium]
MTALALQRPLLTEAEYLQAEAASPVRHEYVAGEVYALSGGSLRHNRITLNLAVGLMSRLQGKPCQIFVSDVRLKVAAADAYYYPDLLVVCGARGRLADATQTVEDPVLIVEVLSPASEVIDRREKLAAYRRLASLREYALVSQDARRVEVYRRSGDIGWLYLDYAGVEAVEFASVEVTLPLAELYAGTDVG